MKNLLAAFLFSALLGPIPLSADVVFVSPDAVSASNTNHPLPVKPENLIDRSGLGAGNINVANIGTFAHSDGIAADLWRGSSSALPITLTFEFNNARQVGYVGLWQALDLREGTRDFELAFFDGAGGTGNQIGDVYSGTLDTGIGGDNSLSLDGRAFFVGKRDDVSSFTMTITSVAHQVNPHVHLGEVMVAAVPEPGSCFVLAFSTIAFLSCRRRRRHSHNG